MRLEASVFITSGLGDIKLKIAQTSGQKRIFEEARSSYDQALQINPSNPRRERRERALLALNEPQNALQDLQWLESKGISVIFPI